MDRQVLVTIPEEFVDDLNDFVSNREGRVRVDIPVVPPPDKYAFTHFFVLGNKIANASFSLNQLRAKVLPRLEGEDLDNLELFLEDPTLGSYVPFENETSYILRSDL